MHLLVRQSSSPVASSVVEADELRRSDERLVRECLEKKEEAWSALIDKYKNLIFSIPVKYEFSPEDASDIFQSVCLDLWLELPQLQKPRALPKWLMQTTLHKCLYWRRRAQRYVSDDGIDEIPDLVQRAHAEEIVREVQKEQMLRESILALRPRCAQLIQMLFFDEPARPYSDIARQLGLAVGSIGFIRGRCLDQLRNQLLSRGWK